MNKKFKRQKAIILYNLNVFTVTFILLDKIINKKKDLNGSILLLWTWQNHLFVFILVYKILLDSSLNSLKLLLFSTIVIFKVD